MREKNLLVLVVFLSIVQCIILYIYFGGGIKLPMSFSSDRQIEVRECAAFGPENGEVYKCIRFLLNCLRSTF